MIGDKLKLLRTEKSLSQEEVATICKTSRQAYSTWERNEFEPSIDAIYILSDYYNVSIDYLFGKTEVREKLYDDPNLQEYINECIKIYRKFLDKKNQV